MAALRDALLEDSDVGPAWDAIRRSVDRAGLIVLRNMPLEAPQMAIGIAMSVGIPSTVGSGKLIHEVTPSAVRGDVSTTSAAFPLHTDSVVMSRPHEYVCLACCRAEPDTGGVSKVLHVDRLRALLEQRVSAECVKALEQPVFRFPLLDADEGPRIQHVPILSWSDGRATIRYRRDVLGIDAKDPRARQCADALAELDAVVADERVPAWLSLAPGDVLLLDNRRVLHGRTAIAAGASRLLWRIRMTARARRETV